MFLFDNLSGKSKAQVPPEMQNDQFSNAKSRALLSWEEHCVECAAPACYTTCDLYDPTPNGKCRRFAGGIMELPAADRSLAHIRFKKWGQLEARGNANPVAERELKGLERGLKRLSGVLNHIGALMGKVPALRTRANIAERLQRKLNARHFERAKSAGSLPERFDAEIFNPGSDIVQLQLSMVVDQTRLPHAIAMAEQPRAFRTVLEAKPGLNNYCIEAKEFAPLLSSGLPFLVQLTSGDDRLPEIIIGTLDFVWEDKAQDGYPTVAKDAQTEDPHLPIITRPSIKCVIFDLDNTLWEGILLEGDVQLRPGIKELFEWLDERGILISIVSKNAESDAMQRLEAEGLSEFLLYPQIGWDAKSVAIQRIASLIDIGLDTFLFVDDNPFERAEVGEALPEVEVLPETVLPDLQNHDRLSGGVTAESRRRRTMYQEAALREGAAAQFHDYRKFLAECEIVLEIRPDAQHDFERIAELVQRTNQLNFSGRKYDRETISSILAEPDRDRFVVTAKDRFGSYGTVGFCLASREGDSVVVEDFMLSCRVQGKYVEQALFAYLAGYFDQPDDAHRSDESDTLPKRIYVNFRPTARNAAALKVLETLEFEPVDSGGFTRDIAPDELAVDFLTVNPVE